MAIQDPSEVPLKIKGKTYRLALKTAGLMAFQKHFSVGDDVADLDMLLGKVERGSVEHIVAFMWAALRRHHQEISLSETSELIDDAGGIAAIGLQLMNVGKTTVPDPKDVEELGRGVKKNPRKARARVNGTGENSTSRPAESV